MIGAIAGDVIGSAYEASPIKTTDFPLFGPRSTFTDDTVLSVAVASAIVAELDYAVSLKAFGRRYPRAGFGGLFMAWLGQDSVAPYNSYGNGSAMRVSPVGFAFDPIDKVLAEAKKSAEVTHNHPEGIKGAQATALAIYLARHGGTKDEIKSEITRRFGYDLDRALAEIRPSYSFDVSCQGTVPEALIAFLESNDYENAVRNAVSLGGDSDTLACITGGIAEAFYGEVPGPIVEEVRRRVPDELLVIVDEFMAGYGFRKAREDPRR